MFVHTPHVVAVDVDDHRMYAKDNFTVYKEDLHYNDTNDRYARHIKYLLECYHKIADTIDNILDD
jgi:hypothetical protein